MTETINGLLSQKPTSPVPEPGQAKTFSWQQKTGKSGKPYIKVKNDDEEHGGVKCRILTVEQTDFVDSHGNISFNIEIEPLSGTDPAPIRDEAGGAPGGGSVPPAQNKPQGADVFLEPGTFQQVRNAMQAPETLAEKQAREARAFAEAKIYSAKARVLFEICWKHAALIFPDEGNMTDPSADLRMRLAQFLAIETKGKINVHNLPVRWPQGLEEKPKPLAEDLEVPNEKGEYPF